MALSSEVEPKLVDQRRFARARNAADADPDRFAGEGHEPLEQRFGADLVLRLCAFDQCDGARERHAVAGADGLCGLLNLLFRSIRFAHGWRRRGKPGSTQEVEPTPRLVAIWYSRRASA